MYKGGGRGLRVLFRHDVDLIRDIAIKGIELTYIQRQGFTIADVGDVGVESDLQFLLVRQLLVFMISETIERQDEVALLPTT
jgi:hypothetical protein